MQIQPETSRSEEVFDIPQVLFFFKTNRFLIGACGLIGLVLGLLFILLAPGKHEATGSLAMASTTGKPVESIQELSEKIKLPLYFSAVALQACQADRTEALQASLKDMVRSKIDRNASYLQLSVTLPTASQSRDCLQAVIDEIAAKQSALNQPATTIKRNELAALQGKLKSIEKAHLDFQEQINLAKVKDQTFAASAFVLTTHLRMSEEVKLMQEMAQTLEISLLDAQTHGTRLVTPMSVVNATPEPGFVALIAALGGLASGLLLALGISAWRHIQSQLRDARAP